MTSTGRRLDYLAVVVLAVLGLVPGIWCVRIVSQNELARIEQARRHRPISQGSREVRFVGKAQPAPDAPAGPQAPSGRPCLAWRYNHNVYPSATARTGTLHCRLQSEQPFLLEATEAPHPRLLALPGALIPGSNAIRTQSPALAPGCSPYVPPRGSPAGHVQTAYEYCLLPGDEVEVSACREGDRLVPCGDGKDWQVSPARPPSTSGDAEGGTESLCAGACWVVAALVMAISFLVGRVVEVRPSGGGSS